MIEILEISSKLYYNYCYENTKYLVLFYVLLGWTLKIIDTIKYNCTWDLEVL